MVHTQSHTVSTAVCSIYDYDDDITNDSSLHVYETHTEDEEAEFARYHDGSAPHIQACMYCIHESQSASTNVAQVKSYEEKICIELLYDADSNS